MRYLVTGGAGFIGSHLTEHLTQLGADVTILDPVAPTITTGRWVRGSVTDEATVSGLVASCDVVFHLAAVVGFANVMRDPVRTILTNTMGTDVVLRCALQANVPVLLTSTSAVYGKSVNGGAPVSEDTEPHLGLTTTTSWAYAYAKAADECLAFAYYHTAKLPIIVARLFNTVGPRQSPEAGFVLPRFVRAALRSEPLHVHAPGTQTRTFVHVRDVVRALAALMECPAAIGRIVNVGGTATISIINLAHYVTAMLHSDSPVRVVEPEYGLGYDNVSDRRPNLDKLWELLGWIPGTPLEQMIRDAAHEYDHLRAIPWAC